MTATEQQTLEAQEPLTLQQQRTWDDQEAFLRLYVEYGTIKGAAVSCHRDSVRRWNLDDYLGFSARFQAVKEEFRESLEELALARLKTPEGNRGSDILLMGMLNANHPEKWSRNVKVTHDVPNELIQQLRQLQALAAAPEPKALEPGTVEAEGQVMPWE